METRRKILYIDLDNTLVDFRKRLESLDPVVLAKYVGCEGEAPGIFALMPAMPGALEASQRAYPHAPQESESRRPSSRRSKQERGGQIRRRMAGIRLRCFRRLARRGVLSAH